MDGPGLMKFLVRRIAQLGGFTILAAESEEWLRKFVGQKQFAELVGGTLGFVGDDKIIRRYNVTTFDAEAKRV